MVKGKGADSSSLKLSLTDPCPAVQEGCYYRPAGLVNCCSMYMRAYNAESPKQDSKRFNSNAKTKYIANLGIIYLWALSTQKCQVSTINVIQYCTFLLMYILHTYAWSTVLVYVCIMYILYCRLHILVHVVTINDSIFVTTGQWLRVTTSSTHYKYILWLEYLKMSK